MGSNKPEAQKCRSPHDIAALLKTLDFPTFLHFERTEPPDQSFPCLKCNLRAFEFHTLFKHLRG